MGRQVQATGPGDPVPQTTRLCPGDPGTTLQGRTDVGTTGACRRHPAASTEHTPLCGGTQPGRYHLSSGHSGPGRWASGGVLPTRTQGGQRRGRFEEAQSAVPRPSCLEIRGTATPTQCWGPHTDPGAPVRPEGPPGFPPPLLIRSELTPAHRGPRAPRRDPRLGAAPAPRPPRAPRAALTAVGRRAPRSRGAAPRGGAAGRTAPRPPRPRASQPVRARPPPPAQRPRALPAASASARPAPARPSAPPRPRLALSLPPAPPQALGRPSLFGSWRFFRPQRRERSRPCPAAVRLGVGDPGWRGWGRTGDPTRCRLLPLGPLWGRLAP